MKKEAGRKDGSSAGFNRSSAGFNGSSAGFNESLAGCDKSLAGCVESRKASLGCSTIGEGDSNNFGKTQWRERQPSSLRDSTWNDFLVVF